MLSFKENIPIILQAVAEIKPKSVLDIGAGMGKFGLLVREQYLSDKAAGGELEPIDDILIDAVEDTKYLLTDRLRAIYNTVYDEDIFKIVEEGDFGFEYDIILMIDIVEHWEKEPAIKLLSELAKDTRVLVSTPKRTKMYTKHFYGDPRHHKTQWEQSDFTNNFKTVEFKESPYSHIAIISEPYVIA